MAFRFTSTGAVSAQLHNIVFSEVGDALGSDVAIGFPFSAMSVDLVALLLIAMLMFEPSPSLRPLPPWVSTTLKPVPNDPEVAVG